MNLINQKAKLSFKAKNNILRIAPYIEDIEVDLKKLDTGEFKSKIHVHIPPKKVIVAAKKDENLHKSLEKTYQAVIKQIQKYKTKRRKGSKLKNKLELHYAS